LASLRLLAAVVAVAVVAGVFAGYWWASRTGAGAAAAATTTQSPQSPVPPGALKPLSIRIALRVPRDKLVIEYVEWDHYDPEAYKTLEKMWDSYSRTILNTTMARYERHGASIAGASIERIDHNQTIRVSFTVTNSVWSSGGEVTADFLWFLNAWGLDFIDSHFKEYNDGLAWSGLLNGTRVTIRVIVPSQPGPYKAWGSPYGHCHGHVWWPRG
jgi:hypothetical protein